MSQVLSMSLTTRFSGPVRGCRFPLFLRNVGLRRLGFASKQALQRARPHVQCFPDLYHPRGSPGLFLYHLDLRDFGQLPPMAIEGGADFQFSFQVDLVIGECLPGREAIIAEKEQLPRQRPHRRCSCSAAPSRRS